MEKILNIQKKIGVLVKTETNPFFKSKYLDINGLLEQLLPLLIEEGLVVTQPLEVKDGKNVLTTKIWAQNHGNIIYQQAIIESSILLPDIQDPQKMGSAITYYRRYALQSLFLLRAEDDDANNAKPQPKVEPKKEVATPDEVFAKATKALKEAEGIEELNTRMGMIRKSKVLTDTQQVELAELFETLTNNTIPF